MASKCKYIDSNNYNNLVTLYKILDSCKEVYDVS